jgi:hypothetical protein
MQYRQAAELKHEDAYEEKTEQCTPCAVGREPPSDCLETVTAQQSRYPDDTEDAEDLGLRKGETS